MTVARRVAAAFTLALSLETLLLGSTVACAMPAGESAATMPGMDMAGMDMTAQQPQPDEDTSRSDSDACSFPWSPAGDCHNMQACAPMAIAALAITVTTAIPIGGAVVPRPVPGPRSLAHTPDPPPPRA